MFADDIVICNESREQLEGHRRESRRIKKKVSGADKTLHLVCQVNVADDIEFEEQSNTRSDSQIAALTLHLHGGFVPPYMS